VDDGYISLGLVWSKYCLLVIVLLKDPVPITAYQYLNLLCL